MEWMIHYDGYGGSCSLQKGTEPWFGYQNCYSLNAVTALGVHVYLCCLCDVQSENVHLLEEHVHVIMFFSS